MNLDYMKKESWWSARIKHGAYLGGNETQEHYIWRSMLSRCNLLTCKDYENYGGRGITVCERWQKFENFYADMGERPSKDHSIDRIDVNGNYEPGNCRWATRTEQQRNKTTTRKYKNIESGFSGTLVECANYLNISKELAHWRFKMWGTFRKGEIWLELQKP